MRRPSSSSCLLLPKDSCEPANEASSDDGVATDRATSNSASLSVTIISKEKLPSYSSERFYLLAEIEMQADQTIFLSDLRGHDGDDGTQETDETEEERSISANDEDHANKDSARETVDSHSSPESQNTQQSPQFSSFSILYLLWKPDMPSDPSMITDSCIVPAVQCILDNAEVLSSIQPDQSMLGDNDVKKTISNSAASSPIRLTVDKEEYDGNDSKEQHTHSFSDRSKTSLYLVVDRVMPSTNESIHADQEDLSESLARFVSTHSFLRLYCEGITVGISNHIRAAPGLEACVHSINLGAQDRRRHGITKHDDRSQQSLLGIVATSSNDMLGLQDATVTDAAQGVLQSQVVAEWNGYGNLQSFAARAHTRWKSRRGISVPLKVQKRKMPRRIRRNRENLRYVEDNGMFRAREVALTRAFKEAVGDIIACCFVLCYVVFHFHGECLWTCATLCTVFQYLLRVLKIGVDQFIFFNDNR